MTNDVIIESSDVRLGLYSDPAGAIGSQLILGEFSGGGLVDTWALSRRTSGDSGGIGLRYSSPGQNAIDPLHILPNGNVGIGTTTPTSDLHVAGDVTIDGDLTVPTTTRWVSVPAVVFIADNHGEEWFRNETSLRSWEGFGNQVEFYASAHLPHGASLQNMSVSLTDSDGGFDLQVKLFKLRHSNAIQTEIMSVTSSLAPGQTVVTTGSLTGSRVVDNQTYAYVVRAFWIKPATTSHLQLHNVRFEYTVDSPLP